MMALRLLLFAVPCYLLAQAVELHGDRTITQVVTLLQEMMDKSKEDADSERELFAKYKCYCDTTDSEKTVEIEDLNTQIGLFESKIQQLLASTALLSSEVAQLKKDMAANVAARDAATVLRDQQNGAFVAKESDLTDSIGQLNNAITELANIGADQTLNTGAGHTQFMAGHDTSLAKLKSSVKEALVAASAFVSRKKVATIDAFLQAPSFTGTYTSQSGEVVGILKDMRTTFKANLEAAQVAEQKALEAYNAYIEIMEDEHTKMSDQESSKNGILSANDGDLGVKRQALQSAKIDLADAETFVSQLTTMCSDKKKQYEQRVVFRQNEQAAISEAISILNSDAAFATFGTVQATKTGAVQFLQERAIRRHYGSQSKDTPRNRAQKFLQKTAKAKGLPILKRIASMLQANNPFTVVLEEIDKMIELIAAEGTVDSEQKSWCEKERSDTSVSIEQKSESITTLTGEIGTLNNEIDDPVTGLKKAIAGTEQQLVENHNSQVTETETRTTENQDYQKNIANMQEAQELLTKAVDILKKYYTKLAAETSLVQTHDDPAPPATWDDKYEGESTKGTNAVTMLEFILTNTQAEETAAHQAEMAAQHSYEDSMTSLKTSRSSLESALATDKESLALKIELHMQKTKTLEATTKEKLSLEDYLEKIKPGCDFIMTNFDTRETSRAAEKGALEQAKQLLGDSPAYTEAMAVAHNETLGDCLTLCADEDIHHVDCKACRASVSVPGYCAGHPTTPGCA